MSDINKFIKIFYQQHAGFIDIDLIKRQQKSIDNKIESISEIVKINKIILNPKEYYPYKERLEQLEIEFIKEKNKGSKGDPIIKKSISEEKKRLFKNKNYLKSFRQLQSEEKKRLESRIIELKKQKSINKIKILSQTKDIKNYEQFLRFYINIEPELLENFSEYIVKNIEYKKIKDKSDLKEAVLYLKKLLKLKWFLPLFNDPETISILKGGIPDKPISFLKRKIIEIELSIYPNFQEKQQQIQDTEDLTQKIIQNIDELNKIKIYSHYISLSNLRNIFQNIKNYSKEDILRDLVDRPMLDALNSFEKIDDEVNEFWFYDYRISALLEKNKLINEKGIFKFNQILNKLKFYFYLYLYDLDDIKLDELNLDNINNVYLFIKNKLDLDLITEIEFMKPFFETIDRNLFYEIYYFFKNMNSDSISGNYSFINSFRYPLSDEENEIMIQDLESKFKNPEYIELPESDLIYKLNMSKEDVNKISKYRYYIYRKNMNYRERKDDFITQLKNMFQSFFNLILKFEGTFRESKDISIDDYSLNYFSNYMYSSEPKYLINNINIKKKDMNNLISDLSNLKSNLENRNSALIFESDIIKIYQPRNMAESIKYGRKTHWCTAADNNNMFCQYHKPKLNNLFIIEPIITKTISCDNKDTEQPLKFQLDTNPDAGIEYHLMNSCDEPVNICELTTLYPDLKYFLKYLTYYNYRC